MTKTRLTELTNEIARLQEIDRLTTEAVAAEFHEMDILELSITKEDSEDTMGSFDKNGDALEFTMAMTQEDANAQLEIECSAGLDNEMANESI
jgi:hypothetical protein